MSSHIQILSQQYYSIFTINQWSGVVDRDVIHVIKQLLVIIRRKIVTTPVYDDVKQYLQDDCVYFYYNNMKCVYFYYNNMKLKIDYNYVGMYPIVFNIYDDNKNLQEVEVHLDENTCIIIEGFLNYKISLDQNLTIIDSGINYVVYSGSLIFVEN